MVYRPLLGAAQADARFDGSAPRLTVRGLVVWRSADGELLPRNEGVSVAYLGRSSAATIRASDGTTGLLAAAEPAFTSIDWDGDGVYEADALRLSDEESLRFFDPVLDGLLWTPGPLTLRHDWIEIGSADVADAPYWSFTVDDATGAWLALRGTGSGAVRFEHCNGEDVVSSAVPVSLGDRCSLRQVLHPDGRVEVGLLRNGATRELLGAASDPLALAAAWGDGSALPSLRLNGFGDSVQGAQELVHHAVYGAALARAPLMESL